MIYVLLTIIGIPAIFLVMFFKMKRRQEERDRINLIKSIKDGSTCRVMYLGDIKKGKIIKVNKYSREAEVLFIDDQFNRELDIEFKDFISVD